MMNLGGWCAVRCKGTVRWQQLKALPGNCPLASPNASKPSKPNPRARHCKPSTPYPSDPSDMNGKRL